MRTMLVGALAVIGLLVPARDAAAHGLSVLLEQRRDVVVATGRYDGGTPARGADVVIRAPGQDAPYQTGRTDPQGRFAFVPAEPGEWRVTVDDGMGHRRTASIVVAAPAPEPATDAEPEPATAAAEDDPAPGIGDREAGTAGWEARTAGPVAGPVGDETRPWRLATGLGLLVGLTGFGYGYTARARGRSVGG